jgi:hypothetical protein
MRIGSRAQERERICIILLGRKWPQPSKNSLKTIIEWLLKQKPRGFGLELFVFALYRALLKERLFVLLLSAS